MELILNLICVLVTCGSLLLWTLWRRSSDSTVVPTLGRGLLIIALILMLFLPAISITDDLAQVPALADGTKLQDFLKAPDHLTEFVVVALVFLPLLSSRKAILYLEPEGFTGPIECLGSNPNIEKRPPPPPLLSVPRT